MNATSRSSCGGDINRRRRQSGRTRSNAPVSADVQPTSSSEVAGREEQKQSTSIQETSRWAWIVRGLQLPVTAGSSSTAITSLLRGSLLRRCSAVNGQKLPGGNRRVRRGARWRVVNSTWYYCYVKIGLSIPAVALYALVYSDCSTSVNNLCGLWPYSDTGGGTGRIRTTSKQYQLLDTC